MVSNNYIEVTCLNLVLIKDMRKEKTNNNDKRRIPPYLLIFQPSNSLALIVRELKSSVEQGRMVTTLNIIKH